jgi:hypothetical protein
MNSRIPSTQFMSPNMTRFLRKHYTPAAFSIGIPLALLSQQQGETDYATGTTRQKHVLRATSSHSSIRTSLGSSHVQRVPTDTHGKYTRRKTPTNYKLVQLVRGKIYRPYHSSCALNKSISNWQV